MKGCKQSLVTRALRNSKGASIAVVILFSILIYGCSKRTPPPPTAQIQPPDVSEVFETIRAREKSLSNKELIHVWGEFVRTYPRSPFTGLAQARIENAEGRIANERRIATNMRIAKAESVIEEAQLKKKMAEAAQALELEKRQVTSYQTTPRTLEQWEASLAQVEFESFRGRLLSADAPIKGPPGYDLSKPFRGQRIQPSTALRVLGKPPSNPTINGEIVEYAFNNGTEIWFYPGRIPNPTTGGADTLVLVFLTKRFGNNAPSIEHLLHIENGRTRERIKARSVVGE